MKYSELSKQSLEELTDLLKEKQRELLNLNCKIVSKDSKGGSKRTVRLDIARVLTAINAKKKVEQRSA